MRYFTRYFTPQEDRSTVQFADLQRGIKMIEVTTHRDVLPVYIVSGGANQILDPDPPQGWIPIDRRAPAKEAQSEAPEQPDACESSSIPPYVLSAVINAMELLYQLNSAILNRAARRGVFRRKINDSHGG